MHRFEKQKRQMILSWTAVLLWMILIYTFSAQPGTKSSNLSDRAAEVIMKKIKVMISQDFQGDATTDLVKTFKHILRKSAHIGEYFVLGALIMNAMKVSKVPNFKGFTTSVLICILFAISDEIHQYFVPGRSAQVTDVLIDSVGSMGGIWFRHLIKSRKSASYVE